MNKRNNKRKRSALGEWKHSKYIHWKKNDFERFKLSRMSEEEIAEKLSKGKTNTDTSGVSAA